MHASPKLGTVAIIDCFVSDYRVLTFFADLSGGSDPSVGFAGDHSLMMAANGNFSGPTNGAWCSVLIRRLSKIALREHKIVIVALRRHALALVRLELARQRRHHPRGISACTTASVHDLPCGKAIFDL